MQIRTVLLTLLFMVLLSLLLSPVAALEKKYLAGPPTEMELMQKANPAASAIHSKSALIPVELKQTGAGMLQWKSTLAFDGENPKVLLFSKDSSAWTVDFDVAISSRLESSKDFHTNSKQTNYGIESQQYPAIQYDFQNVDPGNFTMSVQSQSSKATKGYALISSDSPYKIKSYVSSQSQLVGDVISLRTEAYTDESEFSMVPNATNMITSSHIKITAPDGVVSTTTMFDDGLYTDDSAEDGVFDGVFLADKEGLYQVQVVVQGITPEGLPFFRTSEHMVPVLHSDLLLQSDYATGSYVEGHKISLDFDIATEKVDSSYRVLAEVWGNSGKGKSAIKVPVAWISTISDVRNGKVSLQLDDRWVTMAQAHAPYELRNIRIEDTTHFISLLSIDTLALELPISGKMLKTSTKLITQSMLTGHRQEPTTQRVSKDELNDGFKVNAVGGAKLMLVHGYCSSDVWSPVQSQFSNSVRFLDANQNRSHDAFARLIDSFGDNYDSFGIVAHSQGGAAAMHLYTYYWSGLDNAGSGRLIQSVGTPYQGTPLAGNLAIIGEIFGAGCGFNSNLTTSGASAWLAGIPSWARSAVNYYTTSFKDVWWRYDYCNLATDVFLSDPEDGVVEKSRGQLSGGINRGHTTGQCHTSGMRDMAQTRDSSRNSSMNSNAAR